MERTSFSRQNLPNRVPLDSPPGPRRDLPDLPVYLCGADVESHDRPVGEVRECFKSGMVLSWTFSDSFTRGPPLH